MHETLSQAVDESVDFDDVADRLGAMVADVGVAAAAGSAYAGRGRSAMLPSETATTLAMVLTELMQNAVEHGYPGLDASRRHRSWSTADRPAGRLRLHHRRRRAGLPPDFDLARSTHARALDRAARWSSRSSAVGSRSARPRAGRGREPRSTYRSSCRSPWCVAAAQAVRTRARALRRFSARRSSSLSPPQTPWSCPASRAHCEALFAHLAATAHLLGLLDLEDRGTGVADREEQFRVLVEARGTVTPIHGWGILPNFRERVHDVVRHRGWDAGVVRGARGGYSAAHGI